MPPFYELIAEWKKHPKLRLGQYFENQYGCAGSSNTNDVNVSCMYNDSNDVALAKIRRLYRDNQWEI